MATLLQKELAKAIVENLDERPPKTATELLVNAGYSEITADASAGRTIAQPGVQEALADLGFTEENAKMVVAEILLKQDAEANSRLKAADMVFKVKGSYAPEKVDQRNLNMEITSTDELLKMANDLSSKIKDGYAIGSIPTQEGI